MESLSNGESSQEIKIQFQEWVKKYHEQMSTKVQEQKSCLNVKMQRNKELNIQIEQLTNNSLNTSTLAINVIPNNVQSQIEADLNNLKIKSEQLKKFNDTISAKVEEGTKNMRKKLYELMTNDKLELKPYCAVEEAIKALSNKTEDEIRNLNQCQEHYMKNLKELKPYYTEIKQIVIMLERIEEDIRLPIQRCNKNLEEKLKSLKLKTVEEATNESSESKALVDDISNMKSQLNTQQIS